MGQTVALGSSIQYQRIGDFYYFDRLDNLKHAHGVLTLGWRLTDNAQDPWTSRFNSFKAASPQAVRAACATLKQAAVLTFPSPPVVVTAAIPSGQTITAPGSPLAALGAAFAARHGLSWRPDLLSKTVHPSIHTVGGAAARDAAVQNVYAAIRVSGACTVVIVDDFCTRGSTISDAARAVLQANPGVHVYGLALGKTERVGFWGTNPARPDNTLIRPVLAQVWDSTA